MSLQAKLDAYTKQSSQQDNQIRALESANSLLKEELNSVKSDNTFLLSMTRQDKLVTKELQQEIDDLHDIHRLENEQVRKKGFLPENDCFFFI
jgi:hypothetical protein